MSTFLRHIYPASLFLIACALAPVHARGDTIDLSAANSTCNAIQNVGKLFTQQTGHHINYQCKSSGLLAKGLSGGAINADIYISASKEWMDFMINAKLVQSNKVIVPWGNELVVAAAASSPLSLNSFSELATPSVTTILIGDPGTAPFGRYAKEAMQHTNIWEQVKSKIITKKHITLLSDALNEAGGTTVGILFRSNTTSAQKILLTVDEHWHTPIRYYAAPLKPSSTRPAVIEFMRFLQNDEANRIFATEGFRIYAR